MEQRCRADALHSLDFIASIRSFGATRLSQSERQLFASIEYHVKQQRQSHAGRSQSVLDDRAALIEIRLSELTVLGDHIGVAEGQLVTLVGPHQRVQRGPRGGALLRDTIGQVVRILLPTLLGLNAPNHAGVPQAVQVRVVLEERDLHVVAASVALAAKVHRLVNVADKMNDELQRLDAVLTASRLVTQDVGVLDDG